MPLSSHELFVYVCHCWQVLKPIFVPKASRETAAEKARLEQEEKEKEHKRNIDKVNKLENRMYLYDRICNHECTHIHALPTPRLENTSVVDRQRHF